MHGNNPFVIDRVVYLFFSLSPFSLLKVLITPWIWASLHEYGHVMKRRSALCQSSGQSVPSFVCWFAHLFVPSFLPSFEFPSQDSRTVGWICYGAENTHEPLILLPQIHVSKHWDYRWVHHTHFTRRRAGTNFYTPMMCQEKENYWPQEFSVLLT